MCWCVDVLVRWCVHVLVWDVLVRSYVGVSRCRCVDALLC